MQIDFKIGDKVFNPWFIADRLYTIHDLVDIRCVAFEETHYVAHILSLVNPTPLLKALT